jgi:hypothetical protein
MTLLPEPDPLPCTPPARMPVGDPAGRLLAAMLAVAGAAPEERKPEPELIEAAGRS